MGSKYETPIVITYGWACPIHNFHQRQVAIIEKPNSNKVIDFNVCSQPPWGYGWETKLYGNLKLEVNKQIKLAPSAPKDRKK